MYPHTTHRSERGNVLFLILIAVALFAALSYAVTQSTRGGGEGASSETNLVNSAQLTQYPALVRASITRMNVRGTNYLDFEFNPPADFDDCTTNEACAFHPDGGGSTYVTAPSAIMADGDAGIWSFNLDFEISGIGTSLSSSTEGNDLLAFLPGIDRGLCERLNSELGITGDIGASSDLSAAYTQNMDDTYTLTGSEVILGTSASSNTEGLLGQPFGCFQNDAANDGEYVYYHVLVEK